MDTASAFSFASSYCGFPPTPSTIWGRWNFDPVLLAVLAAAALAAGLLLRGDRVRLVWATLAWFLAVVLFVSPVCALSVALFSVRVTHHMILMVILAPLVVLALPRHWGRRAPLLPALVVSTALLWLWHLPLAYASAFEHPALYWAMQASLSGSAVWLWLGILRNPRTGVASLTALASAMQMGFLGALLVFAPEPIYWPHFGQTLAFGMSTLEDQQLAGLIMWVPANIPLLFVVLWRLVSVLRLEGEPAR